MIAFLFSPFGRIVGAIVGIALLFGGVVAWADHKGASRVRGQWERANVVAAEKARATDTATAQAAEKIDTADTAAEVVTDKANEDERNAYVAELEKRAAARCVATDDDLRRLRNIR